MPDHYKILYDLGDKLRQQYGEVRYVDTIQFEHDQWTRKASWERLENGQWIKFDLPLENY